MKRCIVTNTPINTETITESLWTLQAIRWFLFGPNRTSGSRDMAFFRKQNLHIVICDVTNAPNDPETITKSLRTL